MKEYRIKDSIVEFGEIMIKGVSQVALNTNVVCGTLLLLALAVASPYLLASCLWSVAVAAAATYVLKLPKEEAREGLYTINPALAGVALPLVSYQYPLYEEHMAEVILLTTVVSVLSVLMTVAMKKVLDKYNVSPLAIPYSIALAIMCFVYNNVNMLNLNPMFTPSGFVSQIGENVVWTVPEFCKALLHGAAQIIWIEDVPLTAVAGIIVLIGILVASRVDFLIASYAILLSTSIAVVCGFDQGAVMLGIYGFGGALMSLALFGRGLDKSKMSFLVITIANIVHVFVTAGLRIIFSAAGLPVAAFGWAGIAIIILLGRNCFMSRKI